MTVDMPGLATSSGAVTLSARLHADTSIRVRGRVVASMDMLGQVGRLAGLGLGAVLADTGGIQAEYLRGRGIVLVAETYGPLVTHGGSPARARVRMRDCLRGES